MFVLSEMTDTVRLPPHEFGVDLHKALEKTLNKKFSNKVILDVGLCVCLYDFVKIGDSFLLPGDGATHTKVHFRYVVFRPFIDEILVGKVRSCTKENIQLTMGFFDDIFVPVDKLPPPSKFEETEQIWYWEYEQEGSSPAKLYIDPGKEIRFRVVDEQFTDTQPQAAPGTDSHELTATCDDISTEKKTPYTIIASLSEPGLGCLAWWNTEGE